MQRISFDLKRIFEWLMIIAALLNCHSVYDAGKMNMHLEIVTIIFLSAVLISNRYVIMTNTDRMILALIIIYQIPMLILADSSYRFTYFSKFILLTAMVYFLAVSDSDFEKDIAAIFTNLICIISALSLFFYVFTNMFPIIKPSGTYFMEWGYGRTISDYYGLYFNASVSKIFRYKNSAIFTEAPVWSAILCFAIIVETFVSGRNDKKKIILLIITLLSTESVTSYVFLILYFISLIYLAVEKNEIMGSKVIILGGLVGAALLGGVAIIYIMGKKMNTGYSYYLRLDDLKVTFSIFGEHPLFGIGFGNTEIRNQRIGSWRRTFNVGQSSDLAYYIPGGGIWFFGAFLYGIYHIGYKIEKSQRKVMFCLVLYLLVITRLCATVLFVIFVAIGFGNVGRKKMKIYESTYRKTSGVS